MLLEWIRSENFFHKLPRGFSFIARAGKTQKWLQCEEGKPADNYDVELISEQGALDTIAG